MICCIKNCSFFAVSFYKRVQILISDVWGACEGQGFGEFHDIDTITMFADYRFVFLWDNDQYVFLLHVCCVVWCIHHLVFPLHVCSVLMHSPSFFPTLYLLRFMYSPSCFPTICMFSFDSLTILFSPYLYVQFWYSNYHVIPLYMYVGILMVIYVLFL